MGSFTDSVAWKSFIIKFGGIASAVVIVGALFKIQHWPGAGVMITIGMSSEVIIFLLSALDTFHPDVDWSIVYPELGHGEHALSAEDKPHTKVILDNEDIQIATVEQEGKQEFVEREVLNKPQAVLEPVEKTMFVPNIDADLSKLNIDTAAISEGMKKFSTSIGKLDAFAETVSSANTLSEKLKSATSKVTDFTDAYGSSTDKLSESVGGLTSAYSNAALSIANQGKQTEEMVGNSGKQLSQMVEEATKGLTDNYKTVSDNFQLMSKQTCDLIATSNKQLSQVFASATDSFAETFTLIDYQIKQNLADFGKNNNNYNKNVELLNKNMSALNAAYELQVKEMVKYQKNSSDIGQSIEKFVTDIEQSANNNKLFNKEMTQLNEHIANLNDIYGSMLSAVQTVAQKK